jgi:hypothetical protein
MERRLLERTERTIAEPSQASETYLFTGLCANCSAVDNCVSAKNGGYPVLECEEYEADGRSFSETVEVPMPSVVKKSKTAPRSATVEEGVVEGLCETCSHRDGCTYPRLEGGVWHCEEYA